MIRFSRLCPWLMQSLETIEAAARARRLGHAWMITGRAGSGKANLAYVLATRLLTDDQSDDLPTVASPADLLADYAALADEACELLPDLHRVRAEVGKRSISVDQVRAVIADLALTTHQGNGKLIVIEKADLMTTEAANALLKSLEEPTRDTYLLLLCDRPGRLPATVRSRCQSLALKSPEPATVEAWLEAGGLRASHFPGTWQSVSPIRLAEVLSDEEMLEKYRSLYGNRDELFGGTAEPGTLADKWFKGDPELALECLSEGLRAVIRQRLIGGVSNGVTDRNSRITENRLANTSTTALFEGLDIAENLRDQVGRGTNVELALKALLYGLDARLADRVNQ